MKSVLCHIICLVANNSLKNFLLAAASNFALSTYKGVQKTKIKKHSNAEKLIMTLTYTGQVGSRWYTSEHKIVAIDI